MAVLQNDAGSMRLSLRIVHREAPPPAGQPTFAGVPGGRILAVAAVEHFDRRDGEWWPFVRLPAIHVPGEALEGLPGGLRDLLSGAIPGLAWQPAHTPLGLQVGEAEGVPGLLVEVGLDLGPWLAEQVAGGAGGEACLFRFAAARAEVVRFADAVAAELREVPGR